MTPDTTTLERLEEGFVMINRKEEDQGSASQNPDPIEPRGALPTNDRLRQADAEITAALKGPMSNLERALMVADRKDVRAAIAKAEGQQ